METQEKNSNLEDIQSSIDKLLTPGDVTIVPPIGNLPIAGAEEEALAEIISLLEQLMAAYSVYDALLSTEERNKLVGSGIKNLGFIQRSLISAAGHPSLVPPYLNMDAFHQEMSLLSSKQTLLSLVRQFDRNIADGVLLNSDSAYHYAVEYYNYIREAARQRELPGAEIEYNLLKPFFKRSKSSKAASEPTEKQLEKDIQSLLHGAKEGKIVIENENAHTVGGKRVVSDSIHAEHSAKKETSGTQTTE